MKTVLRSLLFIVCLAGASAFGGTPVKPVMVGIFAQDYEDTVSWYQQNFGFHTINEVVNEAANLRIGFLDSGGFELEIHADIVRDPNAAKLSRDRFGMPAEGFVKLYVRTDDLPSLADRLMANGSEFVREINESDRKPGQSWFMVSDPDGNLVQVFGPTPTAR
jgi:predicted enzyme related to lactoylglutathione lyase